MSELRLKAGTTKRTKIKICGIRKKNVPLQTIRRSEVIMGLKTAFCLICDLDPHHPFENLSIKLALTQVSSEELTPGQGICSG